jgi:hypothetical protein
VLPALPPVVAFVLTIVIVALVSGHGSSPSSAPADVITTLPSPGSAPGSSSPVSPAPSAASPTASGPTLNDHKLIYDVDSDNRSHWGEQPAYPTRHLLPGDYAEQMIKSDRSRINSLGFVLGRATDDSFGGDVEVRIIQHGRTLFQRLVKGLNNGLTRLDVGVIVDPSQPWVLRLTNVGQVDFGIYVKDGLNGVRIWARIVRKNGTVEEVSDGFSGFVDMSS